MRTKSEKSTAEPTRGKRMASDFVMDSVGGSGFWWPAKQQHASDEEAGPVADRVPNRTHDATPAAAVDDYSCMQND